MSDRDPLEQDEGSTLEAEFRQALQHRRAAQQQAEETREQLEKLIRRAREIVDRRDSERESLESSHPEGKASDSPKVSP